MTKLGNDVAQDWIELDGVKTQIDDCLGKRMSNDCHMRMFGKDSFVRIIAKDIDGLYVVQMPIIQQKLERWNTAPFVSDYEWHELKLTTL